jgi:hypothetical protein
MDGKLAFISAGGLGVDAEFGLDECRYPSSTRWI